MRGAAPCAGSHEWGGSCAHAWLLQPPACSPAAQHSGPTTHAAHNPHCSCSEAAAETARAVATQTALEAAQEELQKRQVGPSGRCVI